MKKEIHKANLGKKRKKSINQSSFKMGRTTMVLSCLVCCHSRACMLTPKQAPKCILKVILLGYSSYVVNFRIKKKKNIIHKEIKRLFGNILFN